MLKKRLDETKKVCLERFACIYEEIFLCLTEIWYQVVGPISGVTIGWTGWTMSRGPRVPDQKNISLATQSKFDLIHYSYSYMICNRLATVFDVHL